MLLGADFFAMPAGEYVPASGNCNQREPGTIRTGKDIAGFDPRSDDHYEVSAIACELIRGNLAAAKGGQFVRQQLDRRAVPWAGRSKSTISDPYARLQKGHEMIEEGMGRVIS